MARGGGSRLLLLLLLVAFGFHSSGVECSRLLDEPGEVSAVSSLLKSSVATTLGNKLDAGSGPSPGGNSHIQGAKLNVAPSGPSPGGNAHIKAAILDVAPSGPSPGGNAHIKAAILDVAPSGPSPGGNAHIKAAILDVAPSGPSPGGNAQIKAAILDVAPSGPSPGGNAQINEESKTVKTMEAPSGPSPGGNGFVVESQEKLIFVVGSKLPKHQSTAPSGPSKGHNGVSMKAADLLSNRLPKTPTPGSGPSPGGHSFPINAKAPTPPSGPSPGGNGFVAEEQSKVAILGSKLPKQPTPPSGPSKGHNGVSIKAVDLSNRLPKNTPTPGSGPNPGHNSVDRMLKVPVSGNKAAQDLSNNAGGAAIGCSSDHGIPSQLFSVDPMKFAAASVIFARS